MQREEDIMYTFVEMVTTAIPETIAIYEFTKEIAQFNKILKGTKGRVIIVKPEDYSVENRMVIDLIYDKLQDMYGWPEGTKLANSFSRGYIRTPDNLWHINMLMKHCLLPEDQINLLETRKLLYGKDIVAEIPFPHNEEEILQLNPGLTRDEALQLKNNNPQYLPLIDPDCCWRRLEFAVESQVVVFIKEALEKLSTDEEIRNFHIYGRYGGSGKTQLIYAAIKECKKLRIPFIYRTEFWKGPDGKYMNIEHNPENDPAKVSEWVAEHAPDQPFVLFLDEVDIDLTAFYEKLNELEKTKKVLIVSAAKEIPAFVDGSFDVYDITKQYPFKHEELVAIVKKLRDESDISLTFLSDEIISIIVSKTELWNHSVSRKTPQSVILATTLCLLEALKQAEEQKKEPVITQEIVEKWTLLATSPWWQEYAEIHDVHAEYLIFDGEKYTKIDPHYKLAIP